jgi:CPA1 family monovalent cation:H+ antiporter
MESTKPEQAGEPLRLFSTEYQRLSREALQLERRAIIQLRNAGTINDEVLRRIVRDIDLAEARLKQQE